MKRIVINDLIDLVWENNKPVIHVAGKPFKQCSFLAVSIPASESGEIESIDDLAADKQARSLEGKDAMKALGMSVDDVMQAHASNLIAWVENGYDTRILHSNLSFPLLKVLADEGDATARRVLAGEIRDRVSTLHPGAIDVVLDCCMKYIDDEAWEMLAGNPNIDVRWYVADNPNTPARVLERLAVDPDADVRVRWYVADNPNTPVRVLERLAGDVDAEVREKVASNPVTPIHVLEHLAGDPDGNVRWRVASNPNTPIHVLERLAGDPDRDVRRDIASNPNTPIHVLEHLACDVNLRWYVAGNRSTPVRVLERLSSDPDAYVRENATRRLQAR